MGPSGCGKSTLLDILADRKDVGYIQGTIAVNGTGTYNFSRLGPSGNAHPLIRSHTPPHPATPAFSPGPIRPTHALSHGHARFSPGHARPLT